MKQALEALEHLKHNAEKSGANMGLALVVAGDAIDTLRTAIEAAEKGEPVAWVRLEAWKSGAEWPDDCFTGVPADGLVPLYTTPPAAKPAQEENQRLSALVRAQQITIEKLEKNT